MMSFNLAAFSSYFDFDQLNFYVIALSPDGGTLAIATGTHLLITDDRFSREEGACVADSPQWQEFPSEGFFSTIETVLEFSNQSGRCTALCWLGNSGIIAVGFESGDFACFDANGNGIVEQKCDDSAIVSFKLSSDSLPDKASLKKSDKDKGMEGDEEEGEPSLWILHENSLVATVLLPSLLVGEFDELIRFQLLNTEACSDLLILPKVYSPKPNKYLEGLYSDTRSESKYYQDQQASHSIFVAGKDASLGLYNVGGPQHFEHFGKFTEYVKSRTVNYVSRTIFSIFGSVNNPKSAKERDGSRQSEHLLDLTNGPTISVSSVLDFSDEKRRILRLSLDPSHRFVATSDSLGRVMLFDTRMHAVIRVFKGLREARLAWAERLVSSESRTDLQLALGVYAPRLGLVIFHSVPGGMPLRSVPVGLHCHIETLTSPADDGDGRPLGKCFVWKQVEGHSALELSQIDPWVSPASPAVPITSTNGGGARMKSAGLQAELELERSSDDEGDKGSVSGDDIEKGGGEREKADEEVPSWEDRISHLLLDLTAAAPAESSSAARAFLSLCGTVHDPVKAMTVLSVVQRFEMTDLSLYATQVALPIAVHKGVSDMLERVDKVRGPDFDSERGDRSLTIVRRELVARRALLPVYCALQEAATQCIKSHSSERRSASSAPGAALLNPMSSFSGRVAASAAAPKGDRSREEAVAYCSRALRLAAASQVMKHASSHGSQSGGSPRGRAPSRPQVEGRAVASGSDAGGSSPASSSNSIDGYFHSPSLGGNSHLQAPLKAAILRSPKDNSPLLAGSPSIDSARHGFLGISVNPGSRHGSFDSLSSAPTTLGLPHQPSTQAYSSPGKAGSAQRVEEREATEALRLSFSAFRAMFDCNVSDGERFRRPSISPVSEVLLSSAARPPSLPLIMTVQDSAFLCGDAEETQLRGRRWVLERKDWHSFQALLLMPLLSSVSDYPGALGAEGIMRLHRTCGFDSVQGAVLLLSALSCFLSRERHDCTGVERLFFCLLPVEIDEGLHPSPGLPLLKPWLRAVFLELFRSHNDLRSDLDSRADSKKPLLAPQGLNGGDKEDGDYEEDQDEGEDDATSGAEAWSPSWLLEGLNSLQGQRGEENEGGKCSSDAPARSAREQARIRRHLLVFISANLPALEDQEEKPSNQGLTSFDELLRCVVERSVLVSLAAVPSPTAAMATCSLVLEVLRQLSSGAPAMQDATAGSVSLESPMDVPVARTYQQCMSTFRRLRVALLLSSRSGAAASVDTLLASAGHSTGGGSGHLEAMETASVYQLLAADTLRFALTGSAASAHESRCRKTIERKLLDSDGDGPLLAYGLSADERWRELLNLVEADETTVLESARQTMGLELERSAGGNGSITSNGSASAGAGRKRRPLLLQFPFHNQPTVLGMHRSLVLASRCFTANTPIQNGHVLSGGSSAEDVSASSVRISPHFLMLSTSQLEGLPPTAKTAVALQVLLAPPPKVAIVSLLLQVAALEDSNSDSPRTSTSEHSSLGAGPDALIGTMTRHLMALFSQAISQPAPAHEFVQGILELLLAAESPLSGSSSVDTAQLEAALENPSRLYLAPAASVCSDLSGGGNGGPWPPLEDSLISSALTDLLAHQATGGAGRDRFTRLFSELTLVVFLRFACRLRGARPSELFEPQLLQRMYSKIGRIATEPPLQALATLMQSAGGSQAKGNGLEERRSEFLRECFSRVSADHEMSVHFAYRLGLLWGQRESNLMMIQLPVLISRGLDEQVVELLGKLHYSDQSLNEAIEGLRKRAGKALSRLRDHALPAYKQVAALGVDDDVLRWALRAGGADDGDSGARRHHHENPASSSQSLLSCDADSSNVLALLISQKLTSKSASQQASEAWRRMSGKSNALLILYRALTKIK